MGKFPVTDGQLGQLAVKQHELFRHAKEGVYANLDEVLAAVQSVIEGKMPEPPTLHVEPGFTTFRNFQIGGVDMRALLRRVKIYSEVNVYADSLVENPAFMVQYSRELIGTIVLTPRDFGYIREPTTAKILNPTCLREWSKQNAERLNGHVVELLPAEAGLHIRDQYKDQPNGEVLCIGMEPIADADGSPSVFCFKCDDGGFLRLVTRSAGPRTRWPLSTRIMLRLRKVT